MFKNIGIKERKVYYEFLDKNKFFSCEYSFSTLYMWRKANLLQYAIIDNAFIIKKYDLDYGMFFMEPIGSISDKELVKLVGCLEGVRRKENMSWLFGNVTKSFINRLQLIYGDKLTIEEEKNHYDYIYESDKLINLKGKEYANKRNKINRFCKEYEYSIKVIEKNINGSGLLKYRDFLGRWNKEHINKDCYFEYEVESIEDLLKNIEELNIKLIELYSGKELIGFSIGEIFNDNVYIVHVEKCLRDFNGAYAFINNMALKLCCNGQKFINREEDLGISGLRKAKISYRPLFLEKKYLIKIE